MNCTVWASCAACPRVPTGMACCIRAIASGFIAAVMSVAKTPGAMPITRIPWRDSSRAQVTTSEATPALLAA
ncbi:hypothetical protein D3C80_2189340 [compost metagenome]